MSEVNYEVKQLNDVWPDINLQTADNRLECYLKEDVPSEQVVCTTLMKTMWKHVHKS